MDAAAVNVAGDDGSPGRAGYRRSAGSPRGEARRRELLDRVTDDLAVNGLVGFSLRRAARAAGTTHKVLLYHFDSADDLLTQAIHQLRDRRIDNAMAVAAGRRLAGLLPQGRLAEVADSYTLLPLDQPARLAQLI